MASNFSGSSTATFCLPFANWLQTRRRPIQLYKVILNENLRLIDISNDMQQEKDFTSKIKSSLAYPLFVILLSISIFSVILFYVIPKITAVFTKLNVTLPLATTILISLSDFFITYLNYILLISAVLFISLLLTYIFNNKLLVDMFFRLPFVSKIALKLDLIKVNKNLHKLLNAGITIDKALLLTQEICYSKYSKDLISNCLINLEKGMQVSQSLKNDKKLFKSIHIKIIESGEKSGTLKEAFLDISVISKEDLDYTLKNITTLIEPILITFLGIFVGAIIVSIIAPIYQLISNIGG